MVIQVGFSRTMPAHGFGPGPCIRSGSADHMVTWIRAKTLRGTHSCEGPAKDPVVWSISIDNPSARQQKQPQPPQQQKKKYHKGHKPCVPRLLRGVPDSEVFRYSPCMPQLSQKLFQPSIRRSSPRAWASCGPAQPLLRHASAELRAKTTAELGYSDDGASRDRHGPWSEKKKRCLTTGGRRPQGPKKEYNLYSI